MIAYAFDPGVTTGVASCIIHNNLIVGIASTQSKMKEIDLYALLDTQKPDHIIYESFEFRNAVREGTELFSRNLIGVINLYCQVQEWEPKVRLYEQTPSGAMGHWTNAKMKAAGLHKPGQDHANDAMRHMLYWLTFRKGSTLWHETSNHFLAQYVQAQ